MQEKLLATLLSWMFSLACKSSRAFLADLRSLIYWQLFDEESGIEVVNFEEIHNALVVEGYLVLGGSKVVYLAFEDSHPEGGYRVRHYYYL